MTDRERKLPYYDFFMREVNKPSYRTEVITEREYPGVGFDRFFTHYRVTLMRSGIPYEFEFSAGSALVDGYANDERTLVNDVLECLVTDSSYYLAGDVLEDFIPDGEERKQALRLVKRSYKLMRGLFGRRLDVLVKWYENGDMEV